MREKPQIGLLALFKDIRDGIVHLGTFHNTITKGSLPEYLKNTSVEPLTIVDRKLQMEPATERILYTVNELVAIMYLQVASRLSALDIDAVRVTRVLEKLATDRDPLASIAATESEGANFIDLAIMQYAGLEADEEFKTGNRDNDKVIDAPNLAVGKLISVTFSAKDSKIEVPVGIRLNTKIVPSAYIAEMFKANFHNLNIYDRIKLYQRSETTLAETIFSLDQIKRQESALMKDPDGEVSNHFNAALKEVGYTALTGEVSINRASAVIILDDKSLEGINATIRGKVTKFKDRERFLQGSAAMLLAIVDREAEVVDFYYRGFRHATTLTYRQMGVGKSAASKSLDLTDALGDMLSGTVPKF